MDAVKNDVKRLVKIELAAANKKFRMFAGPHEGAGIIQEEVVEAAQEMNGLRRELNAMWIGVYSNNPQISTKGVYDRAVALAVEAIQTAAMARKFERSQRRHGGCADCLRVVSAAAHGTVLGSGRRLVLCKILLGRGKQCVSERGTA